MYAETSHDVDCHITANPITRDSECGSWVGCHLVLVLMWAAGRQDGGGASTPDSCRSGSVDTLECSSLEASVHMSPENKRNSQPTPNTRRGSKTKTTIRHRGQQSTPVCPRQNRMSRGHYQRLAFKSG